MNCLFIIGPKAPQLPKKEERKSPKPLKPPRRSNRPLFSPSKDVSELSQPPIERRVLRPTEKPPVRARFNPRQIPGHNRPQRPSAPPVVPQFGSVPALAPTQSRTPRLHGRSEASIQPKDPRVPAVPAPQPVPPRANPLAPRRHIPRLPQFPRRSSGGYRVNIWTQYPRSNSSPIPTPPVAVPSVQPSSAPSTRRPRPVEPLPRIQRPDRPRAIPVSRRPWKPLGNSFDRGAPLPHSRKFTCQRIPFRDVCGTGLPAQYTIRWHYDSVNKECTPYPWGYCREEHNVMQHPALRSLEECEILCLGKSIINRRQ